MIQKSLRCGREAGGNERWVGQGVKPLWVYQYVAPRCESPQSAVGGDDERLAPAWFPIAVYLFVPLAAPRKSARSAREKNRLPSTLVSNSCGWIGGTLWKNGRKQRAENMCVLVLPCCGVWYFPSRDDLSCDDEWEG